MQTNRKTLGIIIIVVGLILIFLIIYFGFLRKAPPAVPIETATTTGTGQLSPAVSETGTTTPGDKPRRQTYDISQEATHNLNANDLAQRGMAFAERLGTYSNYSNYGNFTDLKISVTDSFGEWVDKYVAEQKAKAKSDSYYGITATPLTTEIKSFDDSAGTARIIITTERRESTKEIGGGTPYVQKLDLDFLKVNGEWLIDKAYWEK